MSKKKILDSDYDKIVDMYNSGMTQREIADTYNCSVHSVYMFMKRMNIDARPNGFTKEDAQIMYSMHQNGMSMDDIAERFHSCRHTIGRTLKRYGFKIDKLKYHCDDNYFDIIDTKEKAYILGLLWADGCNDVNLGKIQLQLQERDVEILETINKLTSNDRPLYLTPLHDKNPNWQNAYTLILKSYHMSKVLNNYGMVPRKSLVLEFPSCLDRSLYRYFILGYFDGDGSISYNANTKALNVSIVGTYMFLKTLQNICEELGIKTFLRSKNDGDNAICTFGITNKNDRINFLNWMYFESTIKIERKYLKYQQCLNDYNINNPLAG